VGILVQGDADPAVRAVRECFARAGVASTWGEFRPSNDGARDWNGVAPELALPPARTLSPTAEKSALLPV
jgi:uncharacterized LabA/DUF88 family protein